MASLGVRRFVDLIGRIGPAAAARRDQPLEGGRPRSHAAARAGAQAARSRPRSTARRSRITGSNLALDNRLIALAKKSIQQRKKTREELPIVEHEPHGRRDAEPRGREEVGRRRAALRHRALQVHGHGRPELRRVPREGHHARARRRQQRLRRQGLVGRAAHHLSAEGRARSRPRTTSSSATSRCTARRAAARSSAAARPSGSACATAARRPSSKASATMAAST